MISTIYEYLDAEFDDSFLHLTEISLTHIIEWMTENFNVRLNSDHIWLYLPNDDGGKYIHAGRT